MTVLIFSSKQTRVLAVAILAALALGGCAQRVLTGPVSTLVLEDLRAARQVANASAPLLPVGDPWGPCVRALEQTVVALQAGPGLDVPGGGLITEALRLHVVETVVRQAPPEVQVQCGAVFWSLLLGGARRMPGL